MKEKENLLTKRWDESYIRLENYIFYPKEAVVRFINKYVRKRVSSNNFNDILKSNSNLKALDLGCGIGRQTILFEEFKMIGYGVDISETAIKQAKDLAKFFGYDLNERFSVLTKIEIPFEDNYFDIAISDSVLDSMKFEYAKQYIHELDRTVKSLVYLSLISNDILNEEISKDIQVETQHEYGTIQSYYNENRILDLISDSNWRILSLSKVEEIDLNTNVKEGRYHIVLRK
ncbi:class I SAM-dependent methyltransferase [Aquirufa nivalisilvae]